MFVKATNNSLDILDRKQLPEIDLNLLELNSSATQTVFVLEQGISLARCILVCQAERDCSSVAFVEESGLLELTKFCLFKKFKNQKH